MTNSQIIKQYNDNWEYPETYHKNDIEKMLDQARKEEAVEFGYWIVKEDWYHEVLGGSTIWYKPDNSESGWTRHHSTEDVYQLFQRSKP